MSVRCGVRAAYACNGEHLGGETTLRQLRDYKATSSDRRCSAPGRRAPAAARVDRRRQNRSCVIGSSDAILPVLSGRGIYVQLVTSAVREIPPAWCALPRASTLSCRLTAWRPSTTSGGRRPPTNGFSSTLPAGGLPCTARSRDSRVRRPGYLEEFVAFWPARDETREIRVSLHTPQIGEVSEEMLNPADRTQVIADLMALRLRYPELRCPQAVLDVYAQIRHSRRASASSLRRPSTCRPICRTSDHALCIRGSPDCANCGCLASAGLAGDCGHRILGVIPVGMILKASPSRRTSRPGAGAAARAREMACRPQVETR